MPLPDFLCDFKSAVTLTCIFLKAVFNLTCKSYPTVCKRDNGPFTNTCKGGPDAKKYLSRKFFGAPSDRKKISGPPFLP